MNVKEVLTRDITLEKPKRWFKGLVVPIILFLVIAVYWSIIVYLNITDYNNERYGKPYVADVVEQSGITYAKIPYQTKSDVIYHKYEISPKIVEYGKATVYYIEKTRKWHFPKPEGAWNMWYVLGIVMVVMDLCWLGKALCDKYRDAKIKENCE